MLLRVLVLALSLPLTTAGMLPTWALFAGIEGPHVCHCSLEKHDCVCPKCNPDHEDMLFTSESLTGRCGDDEIAFVGKAICAAVLPSSWMLAPHAERLLVTFDRAEPVVFVPSPPPTPPPRSSSSRTV